MIIIAVSDIHGDAAGIVRLASELEKADLVLVSGDITNFGGRREAVAVLDLLARHARKVLAVPGNCDRPEVGALLSEQGLNLDGRIVGIEGIYFLGLGGSLPCPGRTLLEYSEDELAAALNSSFNSVPEAKPLILLCHQPPYGTKLDRVLGGLHVGSRAIRKFIEEKKPLACLCGHIHESAGRDEAGITTILNPGPLSRGGYIWGEWGKGKLSLELKVLGQ